MQTNTAVAAGEREDASSAVAEAGGASARDGSACCAICGVPIAGRLLYCETDWDILATPVQRALLRYFEDPGPESAQFRGVRAAAERAIRKAREIRALPPRAKEAGEMRGESKARSGGAVPAVGAGAPDREHRQSDPFGEYLDDDPRYFGAAE